MRKFRPAIYLLLLLAILSGQSDRSYVLLVSFDGFRPDYLKWVDTPNFDRLAMDGVKAKSLQPVFPSKTFTNHYALATGMYAENHGMIANYYYDPVFDDTYKLSDRSKVEDGRWYGGEPIWVTAEKQGVKTASYFWVGTEAVIGGVQPSIWKSYDHDFPFEPRIDSVMAWFRLPEDIRPSLAMLYFDEPDSKSHKFGPKHKKTHETIRELDQLVGKILDGAEKLEIYDNLNIIVVSDHGMAETSAKQTINIKDYANLKGMTQENFGPFSSLYGGTPKQQKKVYKALKKVEHLDVYWKDEIPDRWHYKNHRRVKDILLVAEEGWSILNVKRPNTDYFAGGNHGYDNTLWSMQAIFLADGPAFKDAYERDTFQNIQVYPIIAEILGIDPFEGIDGNVELVRDIFRSGQ